MFDSLRTRAHHFRRQLTRLDTQPLGKAVLVVILFLDVFILISIFDGVADHTAQLTAPSQYIPQLCRDIVIDAEWNPSNRLGRLARLVSKYRSSYYTPDESRERKPLHALCAPVVQAFRSIRGDEDLAQNLQDYVGLDSEVRELRTQVERLKGAYDTSMLETIARQPPPRANLGSVRKEITAKTGAMDELVRKQQLLADAIARDRRVQELFTLASTVTATDRKALRDELRDLNFWYPVKRLGMEMLFLLPLFGIFYFWNARSVAGHRPFQMLVSSHLLVVVTIPVFFKLIEMVYDIIPRKLLKRVIELLESLKLVAIWHYLLIAAAILAALAMIYLFQKKLFSQEKLMQRRIAKGQCHHCGLHLPLDSRYCPACGAGQYRECSRCRAPTPLHGKFCMACGRGANGQP